MPLSLLRTKLYCPPVRRDLVPRPPLLERMNAGLERKLVLVSAPAGFGKTTLLSSWIAQSEMPAGWISLDGQDNDPVRFLTYVIAALRTIEPGIGETPMTMLQSPQPPPTESILTALINEIAVLPQDFVLVLDDYHLVHTSSIHQTLVFLLDHQPSQMHLVIATRSDPFFLPLSRLRAQGQMIDIRADDLRFSPEETAAFLNQEMGLGLSDDQVSTLGSRTEGWIAGLQLAAHSMQGQKTGNDVAEFIAAFAGDNRYIADYLVDEVLARQPQEVKDFLLQTSILDRLTGPLCDAVRLGPVEPPSHSETSAFSGRESGRNVLRKLEQDNLFIAPLDDQQRWYRYHQLFSDLLRQRLEESRSPQALRSLHQRASQWCEENGYPLEAVEHSLAAADYEAVVRLICAEGMGMLMRSQTHALLEWQAELPPTVLASHPRLCMVFTWAWVATGEAEEAERCVQMIERALGVEMEALASDRARQMDGATRAALVEIAIVRAELAMQRGDLSGVLGWAGLALSHLEGDGGAGFFHGPKESRMLVLFITGLADKQSGDLAAADQALSEAALLGQELGNVHIAAGAYGRLANVQAIRGRLRQSAETCQRGLLVLQEMAEPHSPLSGLIYAELGNLCYERNDLEAALRYLELGIATAKPWGLLETFELGYTGLAKVSAAQGDLEGAFAALEELAALGENRPQVVMHAVESARARLWAAQGEVDRARRWAETADLEAEGEIDPLHEEELVVLVRVRMAEKDWSAAERLIDRLLDAAETGERWGHVIELLALRALVLDAQEREDGALETLARALALAEPEGYLRTFVDEGAPMARLLSRVLTTQRKGRQADSRTMASMPRGTLGYVAELLAAIEPAAVTEKLPSATSLAEPLSERELEVLRLLTTPLSGPEIARQLSIALPTLRFHTRNIYGKLGVHNRMEAVAQAETLGLL